MENLNFVRKPLISVIITYYNMGRFVTDCVESILNQTYKEYEIIIVNDCSDKENSDILKKLKNVKIVNLSENQGQLCALCEGLKYASGEFVCMVDADDILLPDYLAILLYSHLNNCYALISSSKGEINERGEILSLNSNNAKINYSEIQNLYRTKDYFEVKKISAPFGLWCWNPSTSAMWRKNALDILQYFPDKKYWHSGADKVIFSILHLIGGSANIDAVLFLYRTHNNNNFNTSNFTGNQKYISQKTADRLINWNIKLRLDTVKMFIENKSEIMKKFNKLSYYKMLFKVIFCVNFTVIKKIFKALFYKALS